MPKRVDRNIFCNAVVAKFGAEKVQISRQEALILCHENQIDFPNWLFCDKSRQVSRGVYSLFPLTVNTSQTVNQPTPVETTQVEMVAVPAVVMPEPMNDASIFVPNMLSEYVPFGAFADIRTIVRSKKFYPVFITGLSGNGKTLMVDQACAVEKREYVRVNITIETDEDDLLGGFRLANGKTVWEDGPVVVAMKRGALLLLDEIDLGSNKLMCLQPVLEGNPILLKKISTIVKPAPGFQIIATANTKGKGSDDGRFIGTNIMNEAFLERFPVTIEQEYPPMKIETQILVEYMKKKCKDVDDDFADKLVKWADIVRQTFAAGGTTEIISTRRLVHICAAFDMFGGDKIKAIKLCLNRFDPITFETFMALYEKIDGTVNPVVPRADENKEKEIEF